jgi:two-component system sensor histidine kinase HydH
LDWIGEVRVVIGWLVGGGLIGFFLGYLVALRVWVGRSSPDDPAAVSVHPRAASDAAGSAELNPPRDADPAAGRREIDPRVIEISQLAGGLAHEIRNPLSTLMLNLKLLEEDLTDAFDPESAVLRRARLKIRTARGEAENLQRQLDEFLLLVKPVKLATQRADLNEIVDRLVDFYTPEARRHDIALRYQRSDEALPCAVDAASLQQALLNLLINAQQAICGPGEIIITTQRLGPCVRVDVADTGEGMTPEVAGQALRAFFSTKANGSGLGLSTTARIVDAHQGTLNLHTEPGVGTRFEITLPRADEPVAPPRMQASPGAVE